MTNPPRELAALGQGALLADINREYLHSELFARLIAEDGLSRATGNPTIFEHAIDHGTKHQGERDARYVEGLIGPETVNTIPLTTLEAFQDHGQARLSVEENVSAARASLAVLAAAGLDYDQITRQWQEEGCNTLWHPFRRCSPALSASEQ